MQAQTLTIKFPGVATSEANQYAQDLEDELRELDDIRVERRRDRDDTLDFGATLVLVLGTAAVTALARGLARWLRRNSGANIQITTPDGRTVTADHLDSSDAAAIAKAIFAQSGR